MIEPLTLYRLIILYMLDRVEYPLTNTQITNFILDKDYTTYFTVQQSLSDLQSSDLITAESTHNNTRYHLTESGEQTLRFFADKISDDIKRDIVSYFEENDYNLKEETSIYADYFKSSDRGYQVRCQIKEGKHSIIDLTLAASDKEQAEAICSNWKSQSEEVYAALMDLLVK